MRFATIGTSTITTEFARAARATDGVELAVAFSRDADRADRFAREIGAGRGESDLDALLSVSGEAGVDAVYIASPNAAHADQVRRCLAAGKHVLCEKPLTLTASEAAELFALAQERGLVLLEAMRSAFDPGMARIRELLPQLGTVRRVSFAYCQRSSRYDRVLAGEPVNIFDPALGGGALLDLGVYCVHPMVDLFGEPRDVTCASVPLATGADGAGVLLATYPGLVADLSYSKITASSLPSQIQGEAATMLIDHIALPRRIVIEPVDGTPREIRIEGPASNLGYEIAFFADCVRSGRWPQEATARSLAAARVIDRARGVRD